MAASAETLTRTGKAKTAPDNEARRSGNRRGEEKRQRELAAGQAPIIPHCLRSGKAAHALGTHRALTSGAAQRRLLNW